MFSFDHVSFSVENLEETIKFYENFGFEIFIKTSSEDSDFCVLKNSENKLIELFYYKERHPLPSFAKTVDLDLHVVGVKHLGLCVDDIEKAKDFVLSKGLADKVEMLTGRLGTKYFFIKDPNGILLEIIESNRKNV